MNELLWAGVELKVENARFFLEQMDKSLLPPMRTGGRDDTYLQSAGAILGTQWQQAFYANLDAFLAMTRSIPEIINCCFGKDKSNSLMSKWFDGLDPTEQSRRCTFTTEFKTAGYTSFQSLPLSNARNVSCHRTGVAPAEASISGFFGVTYTGNPVQRVPDVETLPTPGDTSITQHPLPVRPSWPDFTIDGNPLLEECQAYLRAAIELVTQARSISGRVHGSELLTPPPH